MSLHGLAPAYLLNEFSHSRDFHSYNKRHRDLLRLLLARTTKYQGSFRFSGAKIWNTLPLDLRREHDINKFAFGLKRHFRSKPNWASLTFVILSCTIFYLYWFTMSTNNYNEHSPFAGKWNQLPLHMDTSPYVPMPLVIYFIFLYECSFTHFTFLTMS